MTGQRLVLRRAWSGHGGEELGTEGDSCLVVFATAEQAVAAAVQAQRELAGFDLSALGHCGTTTHPVLRRQLNAGYVGSPTFRAASFVTR